MKVFFFYWMLFIYIYNVLFIMCFNIWYNKIKVYDMNFCEFLLFFRFILLMNLIVEERVNIYCICIFVLEMKLFGSNRLSFNGNLLKYL